MPDQTPENSSLKPEVAAALAASSAYAGAYVTLPRAEVLRVRRQARLLVFATLRLLEPVVVEEDEEVAASYGPSYGPDGRPFAPPPITPPPITPPPLAVMELGSWPAPLVTARQMRQLALVTALADAPTWQLLAGKSLVRARSGRKRQRAGCASSSQAPS